MSYRFSQWLKDQVSFWPIQEKKFYMFWKFFYFIPLSECCSSWKWNYSQLVPKLSLIGIPEKDWKPTNNMNFEFHWNFLSLSVAMNEKHLVDFNRHSKSTAKTESHFFEFIILFLCFVNFSFFKYVFFGWVENGWSFHEFIHISINRMCSPIVNYSWN